MLIFHQNAKGFARAQRVIVKDSQPLPLDQASRFQLFHGRTIDLAKGDVDRITQNGKPPMKNIASTMVRSIQ